MGHNVLQGAFPQDGAGHLRQHKVRAAGAELSQGKASQDKSALMCFLNKCEVAEGNRAALCCVAAAEPIWCQAALNTSITRVNQVFS